MVIHYRRISQLSPSATTHLASLLSVPPRLIDAVSGLPSNLWLAAQSNIIATTLPKPLCRPHDLLARVSMFTNQTLHLAITPPCAELCGAHRELNPWIVRQALQLVSTEVTERLDPLREWLGRRPVRKRMKGDSADKVGPFLQRTARLVALWAEEDVLGRRKGGAGRQCEACILATVGGDINALWDLRSALSSRTKRDDGKQPALWGLVEAWLRIAEGDRKGQDGSEELAKLLRRARRAAKKGDKRRHHNHHHHHHHRRRRHEKCARQGERRGSESARPLQGGEAATHRGCEDNIPATTTGHESRPLQNQPPPSHHDDDSSAKEEDSPDIDHHAGGSGLHDPPARSCYTGFDAGAAAPTAWTDISVHTRAEAAVVLPNPPATTAPAVQPSSVYKAPCAETIVSASSIYSNSYAAVPHPPPPPHPPPLRTAEHNNMRERRTPPRAARRRSTTAWQPTTLCEDFRAALDALDDEFAGVFGAAAGTVLPGDSVSVAGAGKAGLALLERG